MESEGFEPSFDDVTSNMSCKIVNLAVESFETSTPLSEVLVIQSLEMDDGVKVLHQSSVSACSSYTIEPKLANKKMVKGIKSKSIVERPKTMRERMKKIEKKPDVKFAHKLGELPKYLQKYKQQSTNASKCASEEIVVASAAELKRPKTIESSLRDFHKIAPKVPFPPTQQHVQGDVKCSNIDVGTRDNDEALKLKSELSIANEQLKLKMERIKNLDSKISRMQKELKQNTENVEKIHALEIEVANLKKGHESFIGRLKVKEETIHRLKSEIDKLNGEIKMQTNSFETLSMEKNHLEALLTSKKEEEKDANEKSNLVKEIVALNEQLKIKSDENLTLRNKIEELNAMQFNSIQVPVEPTKFQDQIHSLKKNEEKLNLEIRKLQSMLEDEKNTNISNETLLSIRNEYIKTLQEADEINKMRIVCQMKDVEDYRKQLREFEKFKLAHSEEKKNFQNLLDDLREKVTKLKTERNLLKQSLERKVYKHKQRGNDD